MGRARAARAGARQRPRAGARSRPTRNSTSSCCSTGWAFARGEVRALALGRRPRRAGGAQPRHRQCHGAGRLRPRNGSELKPAERRLTGVRALELADPAEEAQAIAIALREALEEPGRTAALVTPDRGLARRVSAHLQALGHRGRRQRRAAAVADAAGHPAAGARRRRRPSGSRRCRCWPCSSIRWSWQGEARLAWLDGVRLLDLALRGPRPPAGLSGVAAYPRGRRGAGRRRGGGALPFWEEAAALLRRWRLRRAARDERAGCGGARGRAGSARSSARIREAAPALGRRRGVARARRARGGRPVRGARAGRRSTGPERVDAGGAAGLARAADGGVAVRPPYGQHPRLFIWGLIEARLQQADLMILAGLNEGVWPALPAPDPWLAPRIRAELGLPSLERRIGLAAHDFACALGARQVLVTRARRDARAPAIASRFWLRLEAMTGGVTRAPLHRALGAGDRPARRAIVPAGRPAPAPRSGAAPAHALGDRRRPAEGRPLRFLRQADAAAVVARPGRRRSDRGLARKRGPQGARGLDEGGRLRSGPAAAARGGAARRSRRPSAAARAVAAAADGGDRLHRRRDGEGPRRRAGGRCAAEVEGRAELAGIELRGHRRPDRPLRRRQPGDRRLQDRQAAEPQGGGRGLLAAARPARPDRRARRLRRHRRASRRGSNIGRWPRTRASSAMSWPADRRSGHRRRTSSSTWRRAISPRRRSDG